MSTRDTFDGPWKEVLDQYIDPFLAFFLPDLHAAINWERGIEMLDKEFQQLLPPEETERRASAAWTSSSRPGVALTRFSSSSTQITTSHQHKYGLFV